VPCRRQEKARDYFGWQGTTKMQKHMKMQNTAKVLLASAAIAGLLFGSELRLRADQPDSKGTTTVDAGKKSDKSGSDKNTCRGKNDCK
jgi:hypothetical protein